MKSSHYLAIAVRLFAIVIFLYALRQSTMLIELLMNGSINGMDVSIIFISITTLCPLIGAVLLWYFPFSITNSILRPEMDQAIEPMNAQSILTVFVLAIGLYAFYNAVIDSVYWLTLWHMSERSSYSGTPFDIGGESKANMVATAIELGASIAILLKARSLSCRMLRLAE